MGENSQAKVSIGKELGSLVKKNIRDYMMYIVLVAIIAFFAVKTNGWICHSKKYFKLI